MSTGVYLYAVPFPENSSTPTAPLDIKINLVPTTEINVFPELWADLIKEKDLLNKEVIAWREWADSLGYDFTHSKSAKVRKLKKVMKEVDNWRNKRFK